MAAVDGPLQPGTHLGGFLVLHALGSGGMGVVYAAQQERPRRTVAIKVLSRGFRHPEILRRFEHEAEMLGRLQHPGIAQVYAFSSGDRATPAHLVMELVAGPPLTDYARARAAVDRRARRADRQDRRRRAARARARRHPPRPQARQRAGRRRRAAEGARLRHRPRDRRRHAADHDADRARSADGHARVYEPGAAARPLRPTSTPAAMSTRSACCSTACWPTSAVRCGRHAVAGGDSMRCSKRSQRRSATVESGGSPVRSSRSWRARCCAMWPRYQTAADLDADLAAISRRPPPPVGDSRHFAPPIAVPISRLRST